ncbi:MAG: SprT family zinc-dependent metalloprotease [Anaerolineaceae bacterium]|nr:SprT family zinc-dependent metalloprotease [Anaerolineaceae bacterium]
MNIDQIIRTRRKTIALIVHRDGTLVVRAPLKASTRQIQELVEKKAGWIRSKQELVRTVYPKARPKDYREGEEFLYLGESYRFEIVDGIKPSVLLDGHFYFDKKRLPDAEMIMTHWYKEQARQVTTLRADQYANHWNYQFGKIKITSARTRWGSCSGKGTLSFTWRLIMAPLAIIDYVVVHELVHLDHKNHRREFWQQVETILPDYKRSIHWLELNGHLLQL